MLIDFCNGSVGSLCKSDKVSCEEYEARNLVSPDLRLRRNGFLAESFIKPPVAVTVKFPCNIEICRIVIDPVIGRQKSCNMEIYTASKKLTESGLFKEVFNHEFESSDLLFVCVGKWISDNPSVTCFENNGFHCSPPWMPDNLPPPESYPTTLELRHWKRQALAFCSHVMIRVTRVGSGSTVAIRRLEVWGKPSAGSLPEDLQQKLYNVFHQATSAHLPGNVIKSNIQHQKCSSETAKVDSCINKFIENGVQIPEDFIDSITYEMMTVPMLLPCGKNVDEATLEMFIDTEASWGRPPSDPFTAVPFHGDKQAVPNAPLKARIDQFLLANTDKLQHLPRTLGKVNHESSDKPKSSRLISPSSLHCFDSSKPAMPGLDSNLTDSVPVSNSKASKGILEVASKRRKRVSNSDCNSLIDSDQSDMRTEINKELSQNCKLRKVGSSNCRITSHNDSSAVPEGTQTVTQPSNCPTSLTAKPVKHSERLDTSLDQALTNTLSSLPSFTSFSQPAKTPVSKSPPGTCMGCCKNLTGGSLIKYSIPCGHLLCRDCMLKHKSSNACLSCGEDFTSDKVVRVF